MAGFFSLVVAYLLGGVTFLPLAFLAFFVHGYYFHSKTSSVHDRSTPGTAESAGSLKEKLLERHHDSDVAAGYFAVCREYVPGGVNGKPPERTTPAGETIAMESPSVYQSMYRSIFERNKTQVPSIEGGKPIKKARNVFYVVLRHGHLLLFDNSEQLEVRHVISLALYDVDLYGGGGEDIPEGELFTKRNCIRLKKKDPTAEDASRSMPFYLFSDNTSDKEDFYHAILQTLANNSSEIDDEAPITQMFDTEDMIKLVRALHLSDDLSQARWLNALAGRLFLGIYKTQFLEDFVRTRIEKKIAKVPKPTFINSITLQNIDLGNSAPTISNPKLREITVDGGLVLEADLKYSGAIKVVMGAVAKIELGTRFKPRTVTLILATILKRLDGHVLLRIKPPPSNRIWISFETMPKVDISVEPVVSSRQITYGIILRAIESRIRETIGDTLVSPNADDFPFFQTEGQTYRGGIWQRKKRSSAEASLESLVETHTDEEAAELVASLREEHLMPLSDKGKAATMPPGISSAVDESFLAAQEAIAAVPRPERPISDIPASTSSHAATPPRAMRTKSFASAASPVVTTEEPILSDGAKTPIKAQIAEAAKAIKEASFRSHEPSPSTSPRLSARSSLASKATRSKADSVSSLNSNRDEAKEPSELDLNAKGIGTHSEDNNDFLSTAAASRRESSDERAAKAAQAAARKVAINQSINSATEAAKKWGIGVLNRQQKANSSGSSTPELREPYGRGQPLPPPGMPLPRPATTWSASTLNPLRRKPVTTTQPPVSTSPAPTSSTPSNTSGQEIPSSSTSATSPISAPHLPPRASPKLPLRKAVPQLPPRNAEPPFTVDFQDPTALGNGPPGVPSLDDIQTAVEVDTPPPPYVPTLPARKPVKSREHNENATQSSTLADASENNVPGGTHSNETLPRLSPTAIGFVNEPASQNPSTDLAAIPAYTPAQDSDTANHIPPSHSSLGSIEAQFQAQIASHRVATVEDAADDDDAADSAWLVDDEIDNAHEIEGMGKS